MSKYIRIGHASQSEYGDKYGYAGDQGYQNGGMHIYEVREDEHSDITAAGFHILLRPNNDLYPELSEKSARACEAACENNNIGYSQAAYYDDMPRTSLYDEAYKVDFDLSAITTPCNTDCSAFMAVCARAGGAAVDKNSTTSTMVYNFTVHDAYIKKTDAIYFSSADYLQRGDILVREGYHTVMVLDNGSKIPDSVSTSSTTTIIRDTSWVEDFFAIRISASLTNISSKKVSVLAKITKIDGGEEIALSDKAILDSYDWTYTLKSISNTGINPYSKNLTINSSDHSFDLSNLAPKTTYILTVVAKEKSSEVEFSSPNILFTTAGDFLTNNEQINFISFGSSKNNCKTFIKIDDNFNRTIVYNKREV